MFSRKMSSKISFMTIATVVVVGVSQAERIVTDSISIEGGATVDFSYNETLEEGDNSAFSSAPGCPKSIGGIPWLYHGNPTRCYLVGTPGSCPPGKLLFGNKTSHHAHCDCMCSPSTKESRTWGNMVDVKVKEHTHFLFCAVKDLPEMNEAVFDKWTGTCYFLDTQGSCAREEWLVKDKKTPGMATCVPQCSSTVGPFQSTWFYDWQAEKCEMKGNVSLILPVSLTGDLGHNSCEEGKVFSNTLQKCIPRSKAFLLKF